VKSQPRKILVRFLLIPLVSLFVLVIAAIGILFFQQQRLVRFAVLELNKQLPGELVVEGSEISIFQNFPFISITLKNVQFYPSKIAKVKPLFEAEKIYAGFSLPDILRQKYRVKAISLKNGFFDLVQDNNGKLNIIEASQPGGDTSVSRPSPASGLDLDVKKLVLNKINISFLDNLSRQQVNLYIDRIQSSIKDDSAQIFADLQGAMVVDYTRPGDTSLFRQKHLETDIKLTYEKATKILKLPVGMLKLENALFNMTGTADLLHDNLVDIRFSGDKMDFKQLFALVPKDLAKELKNFRYGGQLDFSGTIKGNWKNGRLPLVELHFLCSNGWLNNAETKAKLDSLAFKGYYTNGASQSLQTSELHLLSVNARPGKGLFKGNFVLRDFTDPKISMQFNSDLELAFIGEFLGIKDLQHLTGHINLKMNFKELVDIDLPEQTMGQLAEGVQSELTIKDLSFRVPSFPYKVEHLDVHAKMKNGLVQLDTLSFNIGNSDFRMNASLSDLPAIFHKQQKPVMLTLHASSNRMIFKELLAFDSVRSAKAKEEISGLNIDLSLETSVLQLMHPKPLPKGKLKIANFTASFKQYPHGFHDIGAELLINDSVLSVRNLTAQIDSSDVRFSGQVSNYDLWFEKVKKGRTQVAFDLKSRRLCLADLLGRHSRQYIPKDYYQEIFSNIWLQSKIDLRYDSVFKFANVKIGNISGELTQHPFQLDSISGNMKLGADNFVKIDTLKGKIGRSDFNISMRLYTGKDTSRRAKQNFLQFSSHLLDVDQLTNYLQTAEEESPDSISEGQAVSQVSTTSYHAKAFNVFTIPFIDFNATINVDKIKYHHLGLKNLSTTARMKANQQIYLDTLAMEVAGGKIGAKAIFNGNDPTRIFLSSRIRIDDVNIEKLMLKLDYFGEDYSINKNIKGRLSGDINCYIQIHPDLTPLMEHCNAQIGIKVYDGVLANFAPIKAMSSYFNDKNLNMVRFDTLQDNLSFQSDTLYIPAMNINSSLGFLQISGKQATNTNMEYYLRVPLKLVTQVGFRKLFGKKQEEVDPDQVDSIEHSEKDKRMHFINLKITGTPGDYKMTLGKAKKIKASKE
jgi:uncharacterized protein involved in outer membrane biogenesis